MADDDFPDTLPADAPDGSDDFPDTLSPDAFQSQPEGDSDFPDTISAQDFDASPNTATQGGAALRNVATNIEPNALMNLAVPGGQGLTKLERWLIDKSGITSKGGFLDPEQLATDAAQFPITSTAAQLAPAAIVGSPEGTLLERGAGAVLGGAQAAGNSFMEGRLPTLKELGTGAAMGALLPGMNKRLGGGLHGAEPPPDATQGQSEGPQGPSMPPEWGDTTINGQKAGTSSGTQSPTDGEIIPPDQKANAEDPDVTFAKQQRDQYTPDDPMYQFWDNHVGALHEEQAMKGPPVDGQFTYTSPEDMSRANDVTTVSVGIAHENGPAPEIKGAGNPVGAPMQARIAARPSDPTRNYAKGNTPPAEAPTGKVISSMSDQDLDNVFDQTNQGGNDVKQPPLANLDPVEASQLQRDAQQRALANVQDRAAQQQTGDAFKGPRDFQGLGINVENPKGTVRSGKEPNGRPWSVKMPEDYGEIEGTRGADGDKVDAFIGPKADAQEAHVIDQKNPDTGAFDEHKVMLGFPDRESALDTYRKAHDDNGDNRIMGVTTLPMEDFKKWLASGRTREPLYKAGNPERGTDLARPATGKPSSPADVTVAVTPEDRALLDKLRSIATTFAPEETASATAKIDAIEKLPPEQRAAAMATIKELLPEYEKTKNDGASRHRVKVGDTEVQTGGGKRGTRKEQAIAAWGKAYDAFGPGTRDLPKNIKEAAPLARRIAEIAREANGGEDPIKSYKPTKPPAQWKWLRAAQNFAKAPTAKYFREFQEAHALGGDTGERIDAELNVKQRPDLDKLQTADTSEPYHERPVHKLFDNSMQDESAVFKRDHDNLTNWLNALSDDDYETLSQGNDHALDRVLDKTQDPGATQSALLDQLADAQRKDPPRLMDTDVTAEDAPVVAKKTQIKDAAGVARAEGRRIDPNSAEGKAIAAAALAKAPKKGLDLAGVEQAERRAYGADLPKVEDAPAIDGSDRTALEHWAKFLADEGGAVNLPQLLKKIPQWIKDTLGTPDPAHLDYSKQINQGGVRLNTRIAQAKQEVVAAIRAAVGPNQSVPLPAEFGKMYRALEKNDLTSLPQAHQNYWNTHGKPLLDRVNQEYDKLRDITIRNKFPGWDTMPESKPNPGGNEYIPRRLQREADSSGDDPITNRRPGLSNWADSGQARDWFALRDPATGTRKVYRVNKNGDMVFYDNHTPGRAKTPPASFDPREVGATLTQAGNHTWMGNHNWIVDNAGIDELMAHGNTEGGKPLQYVENPLYTSADALIGLKAANARASLLESIITDPKFAPLRATTVNEANNRFGEGKHAQTILPQLSKFHLPKPMAWALDDLVKQGFDYGDGPAGRALDKLARFNQATLKPFYMFGGEVHDLNVLDQWLIGAPTIAKNLPSMPKYALASIKDVRRQGPMTQRILAAGGNPMYTHSIVSRATQQIAKMLGEDIAIKPWKYDPLMKAFNINTKDALAALQQKASNAMWYQSDVLYQMMMRAHLDRGMTDAQAVHETENNVDSYIVPSTYGKGTPVEGTGLGRVLQQVSVDPVTANFGRYRYGLIKQGLTIGRRLFSPNSTMTQRAAGAAQVLMIASVLPAIYSAIGWDQRGLTKAANLPFEKDKDASDIARQVFTPSNALEAVPQMWTNHDFAGRKILQPAASLKQHIGEGLEYGAGVIASPLRDISSGVEQGGPGFALKKFIGSNIGMTVKSPKAQRYLDNIDRNQGRDLKTRLKNPRGVIERAFE